MSTAPRPLDELREEIDTIDRQLHALIQQRGGLAADIAEIKKLESIDRVRPGREAVLLRALVERHVGEFPTGALLRMWREMISSLVLMEMPEYSVAVYAFGEDQACWDLARDQFGSRTPMTTHPSARDAISQILTGATSLAVVPSPTEEAPGNWWQNLRAPNAPKILYRLPFFGHGNARGGKNGAPDAFAIGHMTPEATGDDQTLVVLETSGNISRSGLAEILASADLRPRFLVPTIAGAEVCYAEIEGFVESDDPRVTLLLGREVIEQITIIGTYATPIGDPADTGAKMK
ncbi:MAG: chorismate mutase [Rhodospirillaceae bacterium]|nr:chorismate mutase [Rhodospirillaceae bacterium]